MSMFGVLAVLMTVVVGLSFLWCRRMDADSLDRLVARAQWGTSAAIGIGFVAVALHGVPGPWFWIAACVSAGLICGVIGSGLAATYPARR